MTYVYIFFASVQRNYATPKSVMFNYCTQFLYNQR